jgi:hypothetical protein
LSDLIGSTTNSESPFLFSQESPTSLDALVYGHLILHLLPAIPDPILHTTLMESHPKLVFYLNKCHEFFGLRNSQVERSRELILWTKLVQGWGQEPGKRITDLIGIGGFIGGVLGYALWNRLRQP